jgi:hypothetical protein
MDQSGAAAWISAGPSQSKDRAATETMPASVTVLCRHCGITAGRCEMQVGHKAWNC